jgi:ATP-dependent Clp protease protease subunit
MSEEILIDTSDENQPTPMKPAPELAHIHNLRVNVRDRYIYLEEIEGQTSEEIAMALDYFAHRGADPVNLRLNSPGGDVTEMFAIHDLIRTFPHGVRVTAYGEVCSAAVLLLACGTERAVTESCCLMWHEPKAGEEEGLGLRASKDRRAWEDWILTHWCELMARYTNNDAKWWQSLTEKKKAEYWLLGGQAIVDAGLADEVVRE